MSTSPRPDDVEGWLLDPEKVSALIDRSPEFIEPLLLLHCYDGDYAVVDKDGNGDTTIKGKIVLPVEVYNVPNMLFDLQQILDCKTDTTVLLKDHINSDRGSWTETNFWLWYFEAKGGE